MDKADTLFPLIKYYKGASNMAIEQPVMNVGGLFFSLKTPVSVFYF
jgi:hypothetical protein